MSQHSLKTFLAGGTETAWKEGTTEGDPVSMAIYGVGVTLLSNMLINILLNEYVNGMAYADDFLAAGNLKN